MSMPMADRARSWLGYESPDIPTRWDLRDVLTYALAVGADPARDQPCLDESTGPLIVPTFATFAAGPWTPHLHRTIWGAQPGSIAASIAYRLHGPISVHGTATTRVQVTGFEVKPAVVLVWLTSTTAGPEGPLLSGRHSVLFRGGGDRETVGAPEPWAYPGPTADPPAASGSDRLTAAVPVDQRAIALYRLLLPLTAGQPGPDQQHVSVSISAAAGLGPPALHGTAIIGHVGLALTRMLGGQVDRVSGFGARFRTPVHPGDRLAVSTSRPGPGQSRAVSVTNQDGQAVLDQAWVEFSKEDR